MAEEDNQTAEPSVDSGRRRLLQALGAGCVMGAAGCLGGDSDEQPDESTDTEPSTPTPTDAPAPDVDTSAYEGTPALPPQEAMGALSVPDGWTVDLVASEPLVDSPVDIRWDAKGRLYVVEMPDYMSNVPGNGQDGKAPGNWGDWGNADMSREELTGWGDSLDNDEPNGSIKRLEDVDGDGQMEDATTFASPLTLSRAMAFVEADDAVLGAHAGQAVDEADVFVASDTDGDGTADERTGVVDDWVKMSNPEHSASGMEYMLNNWLYNSNSSDRFQYRDGSLSTETTHGRGQWGITQDDFGRLFYTSNSIWLFADLVPGRGEYLLRNGNADNGVGVHVAPEKEVFTIHDKKGTNRSYPGGWAERREDGRLKTVTGIGSPGIYRGDVFPDDAKNAAFTPAGASNAVGRFDIEDEDGGLAMNVTHRTYDNEEWGKQEFLASEDEVFRPVNVTTGPDGALYVVDMYNGVFQHYRFMTDYFAEYMVQNDLHKTPPAGRIYRIYPEGADLSTPPALDELPPEELAGYLEAPNGWTRDTAQRLLVQGGMTEAVSAVREVARNSDSPQGRIHALWTLHGLDAVDAESVFAAMDVEHSHVQAAAMETGEALLGTDDASAYVDRLVEFADADHERLVVQAAYSLGEVTSGDLKPQARETLQSLLSSSTDQHVLDAVNSAPNVDVTGSLSLPARVTMGADSAVTTNGTTFNPVGGAGIEASGDINPSGTEGKITGTDMPGVFRSIVFGPAFEYTFSVPEGSYDVTLYLIENFFSSAGERVFDVSINGETVLSDLDLYAEAGKNVAITRTVEGVQVSGGPLTVSFAASANNASVAGIAIEQSGGSGVTANALPPSKPLTFDGTASAWTATGPNAIAGTENPTLRLNEGAEYTVEWTNVDGVPHDFVVQNDGGDEVVGTDLYDEQGKTTTLTFTASSEMRQYICTVHPSAMVGDIEIV
jgi:glucose/arabinose dehydrogenase